MIRQSRGGYFDYTELWYLQQQSGKAMARITALLQEGTRVEISTDRHRWYADEPLDQHGSDTGPTPYELLLGSLAACTTLTLRLYARHKGIDLDWIKAEYTFDRIHADDCDECEEPGTGMIERVKSYVTIGGIFDDTQRERLDQIVRRCPVHKTLTNGMKILDHVIFVESAPVS
jgi:putative redox protein